MGSQPGNTDGIRPGEVAARNRRPDEGKRRFEVADQDITGPLPPPSALLARGACDPPPASSSPLSLGCKLAFILHVGPKLTIGRQPTAVRCGFDALRCTSVQPCFIGKLRLLRF
jgi:hypothetical protein